MKRQSTGSIFEKVKFNEIGTNERNDKPLQWSNNKRRLKTKLGFSIMIISFQLDNAAPFIPPCDLHVSNDTQEMVVLMKMPYSVMCNTPQNSAEIVGDFFQ